MLARCTACQHTFRTDDFGRQRCPVCGAEVDIQEPIATALAATARAPVESPAASVPAPTGIPWEHRRELGFWRALGRTIKLGLTEPSKLFSGMSDGHAEGAPLFFFLAFVVPQLVATLFGALSSGSADAEMNQITQLMGSMGGSANIDPRWMQLIEAYEHATHGPAALVGALVWDVGGSFLMLYALAGIAHLVLAAFHQAKGGWTATFKAFAYSFAPGVLGFFALGGCMELIVVMWASMLQIIALRHAHKTSNGYALMAVIGWEIPFLLLLIAGGVAVTLAAMRAMN